MDTSKPILFEELKKLQPIKAKKAPISSDEIQAIGIESIGTTSKLIANSDAFMPETLDLDFIPTKVQNVK